MEFFESVNVCETLIVFVFRSETLLVKVEVRMPALWPGQLWGQVVVQSPERQPGPGSRRSGGCAVTPSIHPEDTDWTSMGWTKVCETAQSGLGAKG